MFGGVLSIMLAISAAHAAQEKPPIGDRVVFSSSNEIQTAFAPAFEEYADCVSDQTDQAEQSSPVKQVEFAIQSCAELRQDSIQKANAALVLDPAWSDPVAAEAEVNRAFDTHDQNQRERAMVVEAQIANFRRSLGN
ncbi:hypothetical protein [Croceicoccus sp. Ery5]|uniref:hypothetical protein n=1 Tax=Croceicoccus sp. Ery5 TaxID=1703340 RepID=UPI001E4E2FEB|nr:hypothetical protein [Croceicoccus sp. Ery5]